MTWILKLLIVLMISSQIFVSFNIQAQELDLDQLEKEIKQGVPEKSLPEEKEFPMVDSDKKSPSLKLENFKDIAVIQKRFLPKTSRFEFDLGFNGITNNPFFLSNGWTAKLGYYFSDVWGLELNYWTISTTERQVTEDLDKIQGVKTSNLLAPKNYLGLDLKLIPYYGKLTWFDRHIISFDHYFSFGLGTTQTTYKNSQEPTLHIGTGQLFALSKSFGVRWDFSWNFYNAKTLKIQNSSETTTEETTKGFNDLYFGIGLSWFFPGASYR